MNNDRYNALGNPFLYDKEFLEGKKESIRNLELAMPRRNIIAICGSMRFYERMFEEQIRLSKEGNIVLLPIIGLTNDEPDLIPDEKELYCAIHFQKILMADAIFVVNINGYVGKDTINEIIFAATCNKAIMFMEK